MPALDELALEELVKEKIENERWTYKKLSTHLQELYPGTKGISARSLRRFCSSRDIHRTSRLSEHEVDIVVSGAIAKVGESVRVMSLDLCA